MGGRTLGEVAVTAVTLTLPATQRSNSVRALGRRLPNLLNLEAAREEESVTTCEHLLLRSPARPHCFFKRTDKHSSLGVANLSNRLT